MVDMVNAVKGSNGKCKIGIKELVNLHWQYVETLLHVCMPQELYNKSEVIAMIGYNYRTAMEHGWKHREELI